MAIVNMQTDIVVLLVFVNFHLIFSVFSFLFLLLFLLLLWWKDAWLIALFHRDQIGFTSSTSLIETSDSDLVRSMADMVDNKEVVAVSGQRVMAGIDTAADC